jgi:hypothetical protein
MSSHHSSLHSTNTFFNIAQPFCSPMADLIDHILGIQQIACSIKIQKSKDKNIFSQPITSLSRNVIFIWMKNN